MNNVETDAIYCVMGELYFKHAASLRQSADQLESLRSQFETQIAAKNAQILELQKQKKD